MLAPYRLAAPSASPVSLADLKAHLGLGSGASSDDAAMTASLAAIVDMLDGWRGYLGRCVMAQQWAQPFEGWPCDRRFDLPFPDCSAAAIKYRDADHAPQTFSAGDHTQPYRSHGGAFIAIYSDDALPALDNRPAPVWVEFTAGFGAAASDVPPAIKSAILLEAAGLFEARDAPAAGVSAESAVGLGSITYDTQAQAAGQIPRFFSPATERLLAPFRVARL